MPAVGPLRSTAYSGIPDRRTSLDAVKKALGDVINALPTQISPDDREGYLDALLDDLKPDESAVWESWPEDVHLVALTAIRYLGRNPVGSQTLLTAPHLQTMLFHTYLPFSQSPTSSPSTPAGWTVVVSPPASTTSPTALEALKVIANLLVLHPAGRNRFANAGGALAIGRALRRSALALAANEGAEASGSAQVENVFLLGRIGFLVTVERKAAVEVMVDEEGVVESLVSLYGQLQPIPSNYAALSELLKLTGNLVRFYPYTSSTVTATSEDAWDDRFDPLVAPVISLVHALPFSDLSPPLTQAIQVLFSIPLTPALTPAWTTVPDPIASATATYGVKSLLTKLGQMSGVGSSSSPIPSSSSSSHPNNHPRPLSGNERDKDSSSSGSHCGSPSSGANGMLGLHSFRSGSPVPSRRSNDPSRSVGVRHDPITLPAKLLKSLERWCETYLPHTRDVDEERRDGVVPNEVLPPLLLVLMKCASGNEDMRVYLKEKIFPANLDRSASAGSLEKRKGVLGDLIRLMQCSNHPSCRDSAGELIWAICGGDASTVSAEIGYGNAAGLLFRKGFTAPPPGKIENLPDTSPPRQASTSKPRTLADSRQSAPAHIGTRPGERHPITSLTSTSSDDPSAALEGMTQEEKEREAERLFVLFERMERNPVISTGTRAKAPAETGTSGAAGGAEEKGKSVKELMSEKLRSGQVEEWEKRDEEEEEKRRVEEERKDEEEALRELGEYKRRTRGK